MGESRRWLMLAIGMCAQLASCVFLYGLAYLVPVLREDEGMSLAQAGTVVACPTFGLLPALVLWGAAADRWGERRVMAVGLALAGVAIVVALAGDGAVWLAGWLAVAGACSAAVNAASGRVVLGWFAPEQRGLAMGMRQMAQPLGMVAGALVLPPIGTHAGFRAALVFPAVLCVLGAALVAVVVRDPARPETPAGASRPASPYDSPILYRIHAASALLVVPQFVVVSFASDYLVSEHGWTATTAGRLLAAVQLVAAGTRIAVGRWSDLVGSRLRPMRTLCAVNAVVVGALALTSVIGGPVAIGFLLLASVATVSWNGLAFTAVAEIAGGAWAGRVMGIQNTGQNLTAAAGPPLFGMIIGGPGGYAGAYTICALLPVLAGLLTPGQDSRSEYATMPSSNTSMPNAKRSSPSPEVNASDIDISVGKREAGSDVK
ncbi:MFS transporter [Embleya sp. NBC_00888]|uniref:MFS transporter n=1 Tax=Embleya sp. NBC_00888 TaxID=2975960 RepID=UPI00387076EA|nr:MFS transporter [Embleya sp. NBC_00888]